MIINIVNMSTEFHKDVYNSVKNINNDEIYNSNDKNDHSYGFEPTKSLIDQNEKFYLDDFTELYKNGKYHVIIPKRHMTNTEKLNSMSRFLIYLLIILALFNFNETYISLVMFMIIIIIVIYYIKKMDEDDSHKELENNFELRKENLKKSKNINLTDNKHDEINDLDYEFYNEVDPDDSKLSSINGYYKGNKNKSKFNLNFLDAAPKKYDHIDDNNNVSIQTGVYDSDGNLIMSGNNNHSNDYLDNFNTDLYTYNEMSDYNKKNCKKPTIDNPFMNFNVENFNVKEDDYVPPVACNADDKEIKDDIVIKFDERLFKNADQLWGNENSQRQFYTRPIQTIPNQQTEFAKWLWHVPKTCKENQEECYRYENLKYKRNIQ